MKFKVTEIHIFIVTLLSLSFCGSSNLVRVGSNGIEKGTLIVRNVKNDQIVLEKSFDSSKASFTRSEVYLGGDDLKIEITDSNHVMLSALVSKDYWGSTINVNAATTLASCLFDKYKRASDFDVSESSSRIEQANAIVQKHFEIENLLSEIPQLNFDGASSLTADIRYGLVLEAFTELTKEYENNLSAPQFVKFLCDDLTFDGYLNGIDDDGFIHLDNKTFSSQTLKAEFAGALYRTFLSKLPNLTAENIFSQSNTISVDHTTDLFDPNVKNYFFENEPPGDIEWVSPIVDPTHDTNIEFYIHDQLNAPVTIEVTVTFTETGNTYEIQNQLPSQDYFISDNVPENFSETGAGMMKIVGTDVFGNSRSWSFDVEY